MALFPTPEPSLHPRELSYAIGRSCGGIMVKALGARPILRLLCRLISRKPQRKSGPVLVSKTLRKVQKTPVGEGDQTGATDGFSNNIPGR